jgi:mannose-6-phosphate isomerase-like protein (cupin superfamily)
VIPRIERLPQGDVRFDAATEALNNGSASFISRYCRRGYWGIIKPFAGGPYAAALVCAPSFRNVHRADETFFVLEGDLTMYVDGKLSTLHHGDIAYVPKMTPHAFANLSDQPVRFLGTFTPSGFEKFFALAAEAGKAHTPGTPEYAAAMQKVHQQVDYEPLGPPPFGKPGPSAH